ncbi:unnamed protein product [Cochlearia groenlandica]
MIDEHRSRQRPPTAETVATVAMLKKMMRRRDDSAETVKAMTRRRWSRQYPSDTVKARAVGEGQGKIRRCP